MDYDTHLFIEIINSEPDITYLRDETIDGISAKLYQNKAGRLVIIDITDEFITDDVAIGHLISLGMSDRIEALFPSIIKAKLN